MSCSSQFVLSFKAGLFVVLLTDVVVLELLEFSVVVSGGVSTTTKDVLLPVVVSEEPFELIEDVAVVIIAVGSKVVSVETVMGVVPETESNDDEDKWEGVVSEATFLSELLFEFVVSDDKLEAVVREVVEDKWWE